MFPKKLSSKPEIDLFEKRIIRFEISAIPALAVVRVVGAVMMAIIGCKSSVEDDEQKS